MLNERYSCLPKPKGEGFITIWALLKAELSTNPILVKLTLNGFTRHRKHAKFFFVHKRNLNVGGMYPQEKIMTLSFTKT
jgi:hypothetical protein